MSKFCEEIGKNVYEELEECHSQCKYYDDCTRGDEYEPGYAPSCYVEMQKHFQDQKKLKDDLESSASPELIEKATMALKETFGCSEEMVRENLHSFFSAMQGSVISQLRGHLKVLVDSQVKECIYGKMGYVLNQMFEKEIEETFVDLTDKDAQLISIKSFAAKKVKSFFTDNYKEKKNRDNLRNDTLQKIMEKTAEHDVKEVLEDIKEDAIKQFNKTMMKTMMKGMGREIGENPKLLAMMNMED